MLKSLFLLCLLAVCVGYGCHVACETGVITDTNQPGIDIIVPKSTPQEEAPKQNVPPKKDKAPTQKVIPWEIDKGSIINI